jgi:hypothetical protein
VIFCRRRPIALKGLPTVLSNLSYNNMLAHQIFYNLIAHFSVGCLPVTPYVTEFVQWDTSLSCRCRGLYVACVPRIQGLTISTFWFVSGMSWVHTWLRLATLGYRATLLWRYRFWLVLGGGGGSVSSFGRRASSLHGWRFHRFKGPTKSRVYFYPYLMTKAELASEMSCTSGIRRAMDIPVRGVK